MQPTLYMHRSGDDSLQIRTISVHPRDAPQHQTMKIALRHPELRTKLNPVDDHSEASFLPVAVRRRDRLRKLWRHVDFAAKDAQLRQRVATEADASDGARKGLDEAEYCSRFVPKSSLNARGELNACRWNWNNTIFLLS